MATNETEDMDPADSESFSLPTETLDVEWVERESIEPNSWNPNYMPSQRYRQLVRSILDNGWTQPIVVRKSNGEIIDGEQRWDVSGDARIHSVEELTPDGVPAGHVPIFRTSVDELSAKLGTVLHNSATGTHDPDGVKTLVGSLDAADELDEAADHIGLNEVEIDILLGHQEDGDADEGGGMVDVPWDTEDEASGTSGERISFMISSEEGEMYDEMIPDSVSDSEFVLRLCEFGIENGLIEPVRDLDTPVDEIDEAEESVIESDSTPERGDGDE